jgi:hypothetical protein
MGLSNLADVPFVLDHRNGVILCGQVSSELRYKAIIVK